MAKNHLLLVRWSRSSRARGLKLEKIDGTIVGTIGLESYPPCGLLRSAAVRPSGRGTGIGAALVDALVREARSRALTELVLLTTTAEGFFRRMGFERVPRETMTGAVLRSRQFTGTRCSSAAVMRRALG